MHENTSLFRQLTSSMLFFKLFDSFFESKPEIFSLSVLSIIPELDDLWDNDYYSKSPHFKFFSKYKMLAKIEI